MQGNPIHIKTFEKGILNKIKIDTPWGDISCIGTESNEIKIEVFASKRSLTSMFQWQDMSKEEFKEEQFRIRKEGDTISIQSDFKNQNNFFRILRFRKISFRVFLPKRFSTESSSKIGDIILKNLDGIHHIKARFGEINLSNLRGKCIGFGRNWGYGIAVENCHAEMQLSSSGGGIDIHNSSGYHEYNSGGGPIRISDFEGKINVKTGGGSTRANRVNGEIKINSLGGSIKLFGISGNAAVNTKGGSLRVDVDHIDDYLWLETSGGSVKLTFPENQGMDITAKGSTVRGYGVFNFNGTKRNSRWQGQINQGGANVRLKTSGGSVKLYSKPQKSTVNFEASKYQYKKEKPAINIDENQDISNIDNSQKTKKREHKRTPVFDKQKVVNSKKSDKNLFEKFNFAPSISQSFFALIVIILGVYGINAVVYLFSELFLSENGVNHNKAIFLLNLVTGVSAFAAVWFFISFVERFISNKWLKYGALVGVTFSSYFLIHKLVLASNFFGANNLVWIEYLKITNASREAGIVSMDASLFLFIPPLVTCLYFAYWQKGRSLNRKISEQEYELLNMEKIKTKAQLTALEARINPHFLYNSLNSIAGLIHEDQEKAEDMTIELSKLFRATTGRSNKSNHSIEDEIDLVRSYLEIEQMRFSDRLKYSLNVDEKLEKILIPRFLLQPLVENAIKHGISKLTKNGVIEVNITQHDDQIHLDIHDNGPAFSEAISGGYGLKSVRDKLHLIYGEKASLEIQNTPKKLVHLIIDKNHEL